MKLRIVVILAAVLSFQSAHAQVKKETNIITETAEQIMGWWNSLTETKPAAKAPVKSAPKAAATNKVATTAKAAPVKAAEPVITKEMQEQIEKEKQQAALKAQMNQQYQAVKALAEIAESHGLMAKWYFTGSVEDSLKAALASADQAALQSKLESIVKQILTDISIGRVLPSKMQGKVDIPNKTADSSIPALAASVVKGEIASADALLKVIPKNAEYAQAQQLVKKLLEIKKNNTWTVQPEGLTLGLVTSKTTQADLILYLRQKLQNFGYDNDTTSTSNGPDLDMAIRSFQADNGLKVDGAVGDGTWKLLARSIDELITSAILNLDRSRWLPSEMGSEYIYVNLAAQRLRYVQNNQEVMEFKTINGKLARQTPMMIDRISYLILNPTWTVPFGIFSKDKLPKVQQDPGYINRLNMSVIDDKTGQAVDPYMVDWMKPAKSLPYTLVQKPGSGNALGFIKFPMTNKHSIYLHDTNERYLFSNANRLLSSGCIRLEKPFELADKIMSGTKWDYNAMKQATEYNSAYMMGMDVKPSTVTMNRKIPVYLFYKTIAMNDSGHITVGSDGYEVDKMMYQVLTGQSVNVTVYKDVAPPTPVKKDVVTDF